MNKIAQSTNTPDVREADPPLDHRWRRRGSAKTEVAGSVMQQQALRDASLTTEELADRVAIGHRRDPGMAFAQRETEVDTPGKDAAREEVLRLFSAEAWPDGLAIVTLPGVSWRFEHQLFWERRKVELGTSIRALERNEAVYRTALFRMPFRHKGLKIYPTARWATASVGCWESTLHQHVSFHRAAVEDYLSQSATRVPAAWLDFNGPLSLGRLRAIRTWWERCLEGRPRHNGTLVLTALHGRYDEATAGAMTQAGGLTPWLLDALPGSELIKESAYFDTAPMVQFVLERADSHTRAADTNYWISEEGDGEEPSGEAS